MPGRNNITDFDKNKIKDNEVTEEKRKEEFETFMQLYHKAEEVYKNKQFSEALSAFQELSQITDSLMKKYSGFKEQELHQLSLLRIGFCLIDLERDNEALAYFNTAYSIEQKLVAEQGSCLNKVDFADTADMIASLLMSQGEYEEALKYYRQSLRILKKLLTEVHDKNIEKRYKETKNSYENALRQTNAKDQSNLDAFTSPAM